MSARCIFRALNAGLAVLMAGAALGAEPAAKEIAGPFTLWYRRPAEAWKNALPLGNGRLGAMIFGGAPHERIQLNEDTIWNGRRRDRDNPEAAQYLSEVRRLLFAGKPLEATALEEQKLLGVPNRQPPYQPLGDLSLDFPGEERVEDYRRELNLSTGVASVSYRIGNARFAREVFISAPDQVLVARITCDQPGRVSFRAVLSREQDSETKAAGRDRLVMTGEARAHGSVWIRPNMSPERLAAERAQIETNGVKFRAVLRAIPEGGGVEAADGALIITNASSATLLLAAATDYHGGDPARECDRVLLRAAKSYEKIRSVAVADHQKLFHRVELRLGGPADEPAGEALPTNERLDRLRKGANDPGLLALYYQFGRYLLMDCSRPGGMAATLQGAWNDKMTPPWDSKYTININTEMNYWPAESGNLAETTGPLFDLVRLSIPNGRRAAREMYGCGGFCFHHNLDAWGDAAPVDYAYCGVWPMGGAWLSLHFWEHYLFGQDRKFLRREAYPVMREAAEFLQDFLVEDGHGRLVTNPSMSPENSYRMPDGTTAFQTVGATMDYEIIHELFTACVEASKILDTDAAFRAALTRTLARLPGLKTGREGQLLEWSEDYAEPNPGMGHVSHLFALYPGSEITLRGTPSLARAAEISLERRVAHRGGTGGFPAAWFAALWARLERGDDAARHLQSLVSRASDSLLNAGGVFQIDANLGGSAAIAEMLLQSQAGEIAILPALPKAWPEGRFKGLRARGGMEVDAEWSGGRAVSATLRPTLGGERRLRPPPGQRILKFTCAGRDTPFQARADGALVVRLKAGRGYTVTFQPE